MKYIFFTFLILYSSSIALASSDSKEDTLLNEDTIFARSSFNRVDFFKIFKQKTAKVDGKRLHYVEGGKGDVLVLLHGWPETWYSWRKVLPVLAKSHRVIALDLPGFGSSEPISSADKRSVAKHINIFLKSLNINKVSLVAHDMGGTVAYAYVNQFPDQVDRLVFSETAIPGYMFADETPQDILQINRNSVKGIWHFPLFMNVDVSVLLIKGREREFLKKINEHSFADIKLFTKDELDELTVWLKSKTGLEDGLNYYAALYKDADDNKANFKTKINHPVLVIDGGESFLQYVTKKSVGEIASNVKSVIAPRSGHFIAVERPLFFADRIKQFMSEK